MGRKIIFAHKAEYKEFKILISVSIRDLSQRAIWIGDWRFKLIKFGLC